MLACCALYIAALRRPARRLGIPVFSIDTKKKDLLGTLSRPGRCYTTAPQTVFDHNFRHLADGILVPHGVYDVRANVGFITLGASRETSAFVCDAIAFGRRHTQRTDGDSQSSRAAPAQSGGLSDDA